MKIITRTVWVLSLVSLFTDMASEMLYPVMPIYLKSIGFSIFIIGILEGLVEAVAGFSKGYFGKLSDVSGRRAMFVQAGYALSAISKPLMAAFVWPVWVFFVRTLDRVGKGLRTGARDAILSAEATPETKGKIFGFHRSMDTLGAVIGPLIALIFLYLKPGEYKLLFLLALLPGIAAIIFSFTLKDKTGGNTKAKSANTHFFSFLDYWKTSSPKYRKLVIGLLAFALFNSSDVFLLLKAKQAGFSDTIVIAIYIFYNLIFALSAYPLGAVADKIGFKKMFKYGLLLFVIVYAGMGFANSLYAFLGLFLLYGIYAAATEGVSKAWITNISDKADTATAIGTYAAFQSICTLVASSLAGFLWYKYDAYVTFFVSAIAVALVFIYFTLFVNEQSQHK